MDDVRETGLMIVATILERPTCLVCIAGKAALTPGAAVRAIERIASDLRLTIERNVRCQQCGSTLGPVYSLARPE